MSHQRSYSQWRSLKKKKTQPINRSDSVRSPWERASTNQFTALFLIYNKRNKTESVTVHYIITKTAYSDQLWVTALSFPLGLMPFVFTILQRRPWGYPGTYSASVCVCLAVCKDLEDSLWYDRLVSADSVWNLWFTMPQRTFIFQKKKHI